MELGFDPLKQEEYFAPYNVMLQLPALGDVTVYRRIFSYKTMFPVTVDGPKVIVELHDIKQWRVVGMIGKHLDPDLINRIGDAIEEYDT